jgi:hypothetical protein
VPAVVGDATGVEAGNWELEPRQATAHRPRRSCLRSARSLTANEAHLTRLTSAAACQARHDSNVEADGGGGTAEPWAVFDVPRDSNFPTGSSGGETSEEDSEMDRGRARSRDGPRLSRSASALAGTLGRVVAAEEADGHGEPGALGGGRWQSGTRSASVPASRTDSRSKVATPDSAECAKLSARASQPGLPKGVCPRLAGWLVHGHKRVRVTYLVDSGASDCFVSPAVAQLVQAPVCAEMGPPSLQTAGKERVQCRGVTTGVTMTAVSTSPELTWSTDVPFVVANIPDADVVLGMTWWQKHKASVVWGDGEGAQAVALTVVGIDGPVTLPLAANTRQWAQIKFTARDMRKVSSRRVKSMQKLLRTGEAVRVDLFMAGEDDLSGADTDEGEIDEGEMEETRSGRDDSTTRPAATASEFDQKAAAAITAAKIAPESYPEAVDITAAVVKEFADVFQAPTGIHRRVIEHAIETDGKRVPPSRRVPRFSLAELDAIRAWLKDMLSCGWITPCHATHGAPLVLVRKPDGSFRCCQDYRMLNSVTRSSVAPMPLFDNLTATMVNAQVFSSIDLSSFYYQIAIRDEHRALTAFTTPFGNFCFNVTAMGLSGAPSTACMLLQELLRDYIGDNVATFIDDVCMFSGSVAEH